MEIRTVNANLYFIRLNCKVNLVSQHSLPLFSFQIINITVGAEKVYQRLQVIHSEKEERSCLQAKVYLIIDNRSYLCSSSYKKHS